MSFTVSKKGKNGFAKTQNVILSTTKGNSFEILPPLQEESRVVNEGKLPCRSTSMSENPT